MRQITLEKSSYARIALTIALCVNEQAIMAAWLPLRRAEKLLHYTRARYAYLFVIAAEPMPLKQGNEG